MESPTLACCGKLPGVLGDLGVTTEQGGPMTAASPLAVPLHRDGHNTRSRTEQTSVLVTLFWPRRFSDGTTRSRNFHTVPLLPPRWPAPMQGAHCARKNCAFWGVSGNAAPHRNTKRGASGRLPNKPNLASREPARQRPPPARRFTLEGVEGGCQMGTSKSSEKQQASQRSRRQASQRSLNSSPGHNKELTQPKCK